MIQLICYNFVSTSTQTTRLELEKHFIDKINNRPSLALRIANGQFNDLDLQFVYSALKNNLFGPIILVISILRLSKRTTLTWSVLSKIAESALEPYHSQLLSLFLSLALERELSLLGHLTYWEENQ